MRQRGAADCWLISLAADTKAYRFIERSILRGACLWAMKCVLQLPPLRFGLPLRCEVAVGHEMVTRRVSEAAAV